GPPTPRGGPGLVEGRATPHHAPRGLAPARTRPDPVRRGPGPIPRPLVAADPRVDRRTLEPRALPVVLRGDRRGAAADHQPVGRDRGRRLLPVPPPDQPPRTRP